MKEYPIIEIINNGHKDGKYVDANHLAWNVTRLIEHSKDLPVFQIPLAGINLGQDIFPEAPSAMKLAVHVKRAMEADLSCPILLDPNGFIMDGWHRVVKALVTGQPTLPARRFTPETMPCYEFTSE